MSQDHQSSRPPINPPALTTFDRFLATHENGDLNNDLSEALREMIAAMSNHVMDHGGKPKGEISLKLKFSLDGGMFHCEADMDFKVPKAPRSAGVYFATDGNQLTKQDPRQLKMFEDVNSGRGAPPVTVS